MEINFEGLIVLLLFVAPGFLYSRAYLAVRPRYRRSSEQLQQVVLAIIGSAIIHSVLLGMTALLLLLYMRVSGQDWAVDQILPASKSPANMLLSDLAIYLLVVAGYIGLSLVIAQRIGTWAGKLVPERTPKWYKFLLGDTPPERVLLWWTMLVEEPLRSNYRAQVAVQLKSGDRFEGTVADLRLMNDDAGTVELALERALHVTSAAGNDNATSEKIMPSVHAGVIQRVMLKSSDVIWIGRVDQRG